MLMLLRLAPMLRSERNATANAAHNKVSAASTM